MTQWDDEHFDSSVYNGQRYSEDVFHDDALMFFDEDIFDEAEIPPDIIEIANLNRVYGPMTIEDYNEYCIATAQDFLLSTSTLRFNMSGLNPPGSMQTTSSGTSGGNSQNSSTQYAAVFVVDTLQDVANPANGAMSLRKAITLSNAVSGTSLITFADTLTGTITLNGTALPTLTKSIDVIGPGSDILTISGNDLSRMFTANKADTTVTLAGMTLTNGMSTSNGGAISFSAASGVLYDLVVQNSETTGSYGGAIYVTGSDSFEMDNCIIIGNQTATTSGKYGGGAWISYVNDVTITNSVFDGNASYYGGGLTLYSNGHNTLDNVVINDNTANTGGGLYASRTTSETYLDKTNDITITYSRLIDNEATSHAGGAIFAYSENVAITDSIISGNTASTSVAGGVYFYSTGGSTVSGSIIRDNTATTYGGGISTGVITSGVFAGLANDITITDTTMSGNTAVSYGGAVYSSGSMLHVSASVFEENTAEVGGAVFRVGTAGSSFTDVTFTGNQATSPAHGGGAIFISISSQEIMTIAGSTLTGNDAQNGSGGAIDLRGGTLDITDSVLNANTAATCGGGISVISSATLNISGTTMTNNTSATYGGGVYTKSTGSLALNDSLLLNNTSERGGGVSQANGTVTVEGTRFFGNHATLNGGGFYQIGGTSQIAADFQENTADSLGGGICLTGASVMTVLQSTLHDNIACDKGGGIHVSSSTPVLHIYNTTISGNKAESANGQTSTNEGGGIYFSGSSAVLTIVNSTIAYNKAYLGGGIRTTTSNATIHNTIIAKNTASTLARGYDVYGTLQSTSSNNLIGINTGLTGITNNTNGNKIGTQSTPLDPRFTPLQNNGGKTKTHALMEDSPAINNGNNALALDANNNPLPYDQRGFTRLYGSAVDIGAFEWQPYAVDGYYLANCNQPLMVDAKHGVLINDRLNENAFGGYSLFVDVYPQHGQVVLEQDGSFIYTPDGDFFGTDVFTYVAIDCWGNKTSAVVRIDVVDDLPATQSLEDLVTQFVTPEFASPIDTSAALVLPKDGGPIVLDVLADPSRQIMSVDVSVGEATIDPAKDSTDCDAILWTPPAGYTGTPVITCIVKDAQNNLTTKAANVQVVNTSFALPVFGGESESFSPGGIVYDFDAATPFHPDFTGNFSLSINETTPYILTGDESGQSLYGNQTLTREVVSRDYGNGDWSYSETVTWSYSVGNGASQNDGMLEYSFCVCMLDGVEYYSLAMTTSDTSITNVAEGGDSLSVALAMTTSSITTSTFDTNTGEISGNESTT